MPPFIDTGMQYREDIYSEFSIGSPNILLDSKIVAWKTADLVSDLKFNPGLFSGHSVRINSAGTFCVGWLSNNIVVLDVKRQQSFTFSFSAIPGEPGNSNIKNVCFVGNDRLFATTSQGLWNILKITSSGLQSTPLKKSWAKANGYDPGESHFAASPDGRWVACKRGGLLALIDVPAATIAWNVPVAGGQAVVGFEPEGTEICMAQHVYNSLHVVNFSLEGKQVSAVEAAFPGEDDLFEPDRFFCLPRKQGWFVGNAYIDRDLKRPLAVFLSRSRPSRGLVWPLDDRYIFVDLAQGLRRVGEPRHCLQLCEFPWEKVAATKAALQAQAPAALSDKSAVAFEIVGQQTDLLQRSESFIKKRLGLFGLLYAADSPHKILLKSRGWLDRSATPPRPYEEVTISMFVAGRELPAYQTVEYANLGEATQLDFVQPGGNLIQLRGSNGQPSPCGKTFHPPYFVPESPDLLTLPIVLH